MGTEHAEEETEHEQGGEEGRPRDTWRAPRAIAPSRGAEAREDQAAQIDLGAVSAMLRQKRRGIRAAVLTLAQSPRKKFSQSTREGRGIARDNRGHDANRYSAGRDSY